MRLQSGTLPQFFFPQWVFSPFTEAWQMQTSAQNLRKVRIHSIFISYVFHLLPFLFYLVVAIFFPPSCEEGSRFVTSFCTHNQLHMFIRIYHLRSPFSHTLTCNHLLWLWILLYSSSSSSFIAYFGTDFKGISRVFAEVPSLNENSLNW